MAARQFSIRYKILLLLTTITSVALVSFVFMATKIFKEDKMAYVFDSTSNLSGTLAGQIKNQLNSVLIASKPLFEEYLSQRRFSQVSETLFKNDQLTDAIFVYETNRDFSKVEKKSVIEKSQGLADEAELEVYTQLTQNKNSLVNSDKFVSQLSKDSRLVLIQKAENKDSQNLLFFVLLLRLSEIEEMFKNSLAQKLYLIDGQGKILFGSEGQVGQNLTQLLQLKFLSNPQKSAQSVEVTEDVKKQPVLVSYSKVGFSDLYVISSVLQKNALSALDVLFRKSFIFFVLLISLTVMVSLLATGQLTKALTSLFDATKKVSEGQFDIQVKVKSNDEVGALADNFNLMAAEVSRLLGQTAEKARMENELKTAQTVQETLFPQAYSQLGPLEVAGFYEPASECGGDWWHYCQVGNKIFFWIGDATGHGAPSALLTSAAKSASSIIERLNVSPGQAMELLNRCIYDVSRGRLMMTFFIGAYDITTKELTYSNASHEAPFLIKKSDEALKKKSLIPLNEVNSPRLGQARETKYAESKVQIDPGDLVFFYTDGIPDIRNAATEAWGEREFVKCIVSSNKDYPSAQDSVKRFSTSFQEYRQGSTLVDDVTFFVVKCLG